MNILIFAEYFKGSGIGTYLNTLLNYLLKNNSNSIELVLMDSDPFDDSQFDDSRLKIIEFQNTKNFPWLSLLKKFPFSILLDYFNFRKINYNDSYDLIIISTRSTVKNLGIFLVRCRVVFILHSVPKKIKSKMFLNIGSVLKGIMKKKDILLTVSEFAKLKAVKFYNIPENKIIVVHNTIDETRYQKSTGEIQEGKGIINILTLGHIVLYKNILLWVDVANFLCEKYEFLYFYWAGPVIDEFLLEKALLRINKKFKNRIIIYPRVMNSINLLHLSDIYFHPSNLENHSLSIIEALYLGKPIVCTNIGGNSESVIQNWNGFLFEPNDFEMVKDYICRLVTNSDLRKAFGARSLEIFKERFSYDKWSKKMDQLIYY